MAMKEFKLLILLIVLNVSVHAQASKDTIKDYSIIKTTDISIENFSMRKVVTAYDLALNLSYMLHVTQSFKGEYLILPLISINEKSVNENLLKKINISDVLEFQFDSGSKTKALYGSKGQYGHLNFYLKEENKNK